MSFDVIATEPFEKKLKRLAKKYKTLVSDLAPVIDELSENPTLGTPTALKGTSQENYYLLTGGSTCRNGGSTSQEFILLPETKTFCYVLKAASALFCLPRRPVQCSAGVGAGSGSAPMYAVC
jgi:hypothetical protein